MAQSEQREREREKRTSDGTAPFQRNLLKRERESMVDRVGRESERAEKGGADAAPESDRPTDRDRPTYQRGRPASHQGLANFKTRTRLLLD